MYVELRGGVIEPHVVGLEVCEDSGLYVEPQDRPGGTGSSRPTRTAITTSADRAEEVAS